MYTVKHGKKKYFPAITSKQTERKCSNNWTQMITCK